jgi:hypothetical protein
MEIMERIIGCFLDKLGHAGAFSTPLGKYAPVKFLNSGEKVFDQKT